MVLLSARHNGDEIMTRTDKRADEDREKEPKQSSHMGAEEGDIKQTKPPTQELAKMTSKKGEASSPHDDDYSPADEITPG
jgi:hypothetical protein